MDNGGLRYGAMESARRPPLPTATRVFAEIQIQVRLTNRSRQNIILSIRGSRRQVADIKSEPRPASNRNWWPASYWNAWPASSETATIYDPWHYVPVLARKPGALRNGAPFKDWVLPTAMERIRRKLAGSNDGDRQMVKILAAALTDGLPAVEAACLQALSEGVHSADVILNILARQRDPGPAATILTPEALRLRHAPTADCARYDQLRSA